ncbi:sulfatase-like hydrolase/transferase [Maribellus comscasis]|uniref:Sulfatase-like hydrolase/transferase n=1 Tax=Maribellus comscasis TaxID=2681766 RepID=A0A6I6K191_9BACT|nr:sulfatase [Maribellus comscasis]QGY47220.1 sulfatase-like hydrolase/transferase [Maribellus comscasis]
MKNKLSRTIVKLIVISAFFIVVWLLYSNCSKDKIVKHPNILFVISDDQSYPHASAYECKFVNTPAFDRVASEGILFDNCFAASPSCSPSRAAILTGKNIWQLEEAGSHISYFPRKFTSFTEVLEKNGYLVGYTGKPWAPGNWRDSGWDKNPVGTAYSDLKNTPPTSGISDIDYTANFVDFLSNRTESQPFFFWCGMFEPHRGYEKGSGLKAGKKLEDAEVPTFLLDDDITRMDLLDYALEIEWFDSHLGKIINFLEKTGELDNTVIVVTSDNGMPFPRAKIQLYEFGIHVPLAIRWGDQIKPKRNVSDFIGFNDFAPTFLEIAGISDSLNNASGKSFLDVLLSEKSGRIDQTRTFALSGKERHNYSRANNLGYPIRGIRTDTFLYLRNFEPDRWPAGDPDLFLDGELNKLSGITILNKKEVNTKANKLFHLMVDKRPSEELYNIVDDPGCIHNLSDNPDFSTQLKQLRIKLEGELTWQSDPRVVGNGNVFDSYPTFKPIQLFDKNGKSLFPGFAAYGEYNESVLYDK